MMLSDIASPPSQPSLVLLSNAPPQPPNGPGLLPTFESGPLFLVGVGLAVGGNTLIACSLTLQKFCVNREVATGVKTGSMPLFWLALAGMIGGEVGNFAAFGFCSQTVVSPLGAVSVIVNTVLAAVFLGEKIYWRTVVGIGLTLTGSVGVVLFSPPAVGDLTCDSFISKLASPYAYGYLIVVAVAIAALWLVELRWASRLCGKQGLYGRPARPKRLIGRDWPKLGAAWSTIWR